MSAYMETSEPELAYGVTAVNISQPIKPILPKPLAIPSVGLVTAQGKDDLAEDIGQVNRTFNPGT